MIKTKKDEPLDKKQKIAKLLEYHSPLLKKLGVDNPHYCPKMAYPDNGVKVVSFFPSEMEKGEDIYTEFVSRDYDSEDPERVLYKLPYNPHYAQEYKTTVPNAQGVIRYIVPVEELIVCESLIEASNDFEDEDFDIPNPDEDSPIAALTMRDAYAIFHNKAVSHKPWLNKLINQNK